MAEEPVSAAPRVSLEQWRAFVEVVDAGGYAQAAARLHKSQSTVTYAVQQLENGLGINVFVVEGRRSVLTPAGRLVYERARLLLDDASGLERTARRASSGWEAEIRLAVEVLFPNWLLLECLDIFGRESPNTRLEVFETVLDGTREALESGRADLAISPRIPTNFTGEPLMPVRFLPVAHPSHPLHQLGRDITMRDLRQHRHILVRGTGSQRERSQSTKRRGTVESRHRWTVTNMATSIGAVCRAYGFAWLPTDKIRAELAAGELAPLPLRGGRERTEQLYLIFGDGESAGPGTRRLAEILKSRVDDRCAGEPAPAAGMGRGRLQDV